MSEIDLGGFSLDSKDLVKQIKKDLQDDWFRDPLEFKDMLSAEEIKNKLLNNIEKNHGIYQPSERRVFDIPKQNHMVRYSMEKSLCDRVFYQGVTAYLMKYFDPLFSERVYSHRLEVDPKLKKKRLFRSGIEQWKSFTGIVRSVVDGKVLLVTDLTNYFENIRIDGVYGELKDLIHELNVDGLEKIKVRRAIDVLYDCLKVWSYSGTHGLPQNRDASSFLANVFMHSIDREMLSLGYNYHRYMDDIKIVCDDVYEARKALMCLTRSLREKGLALNSKKTMILSERDKILEELDVDRRVEQIDALWKSKKKETILRSIRSLLEYLDELMGEGRTQDRAFRFCINRLERLCRCSDLSIQSKSLSKLTTSVISQLEDNPVSTDQYIKYLKSVVLDDCHRKMLVDFLCDQRKSIYSWQNYLVWQLCTLKEIDDARLKERAQAILSDSDECEANKAGASLYFGSLGDGDQRLDLAKGFKDCKGYLQQRLTLIGLHEIQWSEEVRGYIAPFLDDELQGVLKNLKSQKFRGTYCQEPDPADFKSLYDEVAVNEY